MDAYDMGESDDDGDGSDDGDGDVGDGDGDDNGDGGSDDDDDDSSEDETNELSGSHTTYFLRMHTITRYIDEPLPEPGQSVEHIKFRFWHFVVTYPNPPGIHTRSHVFTGHTHSDAPCERITPLPDAPRRRRRSEDADEDVADAPTDDEDEDNHDDDAENDADDARTYYADVDADNDDDDADSGDDNANHEGSSRGQHGPEYWPDVDGVGRNPTGTGSSSSNQRRRHRSTGGLCTAAPQRTELCSASVTDMCPP